MSSSGGSSRPEPLLSFDDLLLAMAQQHQGIEHLLDTIFCFFGRKTDLYHVMRSKEDKMGFPLGYSEDMVISIMRRYQLEYLQQNEPDEIKPLKERWRKVDGPGRFYNRSQSSSANDSTDGCTPRPEDADRRAPAAREKAAKNSSSSSSSSSSSHPSPTPVVSEAGAADAGKTSGHASDSLDRAKHISRLSLFPPTFTLYGSKRFEWSRFLVKTLNDLTVEVSLRANTKGKDLSVTIKPDNISIKYKGDGSTVLVGDLDMSIVPSESSWLIEDGDKLILSLDKAVHTWWKCVLRGDEQIDTTKVESSKTVSELDESSQGALRKMLFDQNQKAQGKPTSDQIRMQEIMKDAWDADNSPFKGSMTLLFVDPHSDYGQATNGGIYFLELYSSNSVLGGLWRDGECQGAMRRHVELLMSFRETWEKFEEARLARAVEAKRGDSESKGQ